MRDYPLESAPGGTAVYYERADVETICLEEMKKVGLVPREPSPVRIERFIEKRFGIPIEYERLESGVWGKTVFGKNGPEVVIISSELSESSNPVHALQVQSTLAHEAGHCLLHGHLYGLGDQHRFLCRDVGMTSKAVRTHNYWHEHQANMCIGPLLLPQPLVRTAWKQCIDAEQNVRINQIATTFNASYTVTQIRLRELGLTS